MLIPPGSVRVLLASKPVDFRRGMDGLAALVKEQLRFDPFAGTLYIFRPIFYTFVRRRMDKSLILLVRIMVSRGFRSRAKGQQ